MGRRRKRRRKKTGVLSKAVLFLLLIFLALDCGFLIWAGVIKRGGTKETDGRLSKGESTVSQVLSKPAEERGPKKDQEDAEEPEVSEPEPEPEPEQTEEELLEEKARAALEGMTLEEKVLQLFLITPEALTGYETVTAAGESTKAGIEQYPVGGLIYFAKNLQTPGQVRTMLGNTLEYYEAAGAPMPFLAVDEEGGTVARIGGQAAFGTERFSDMCEVGKTGDTEEAGRIGRVIGAYLSDLGFNLDFAPVADVLTNPGNTVVAKRSFGSDADLVTGMVLAEAEGIESQGVYAALKHYPGHGSTLSDTHAGYAYTDKTLEELMEAELVPFQAGIENGISFIMAAHISVPGITGDSTPCSLSRTMVTEVLREQMGYDGIVVTDAMNMGAISRQYNSSQAAVLALKAGVDLILMPADFKSAYQGVISAVQSGELTEARVDESVRRILRAKFRLEDPAG